MDATATLRSPVHVDRQDPKYRMYHSNRYDDGFGTRYIPPLTRDEHSKREYLGAPYQFAADNEDNPFESSCLTNRLPSPEPGFGRRVFLQGSLSEVVEHWDGEDDFSTPGGEWYWRQREEEEYQDALLAEQHREELLAVVSSAPFARADPSIARRVPGFYGGIWHPYRVDDVITTSDDDGDIENPRPVKRRRGRPCNEERAAVVRGVVVAGLLPSKRKLGKRPARRLEAGELRGAEVVNDMAVVAPVKRGRGRPRKIAVDSMTLQSPIKVWGNGGAVSERTAPETLPPPGRVGGGGKFKPGEAPWSKAALPLSLEKEPAGNGSATSPFVLDLSAENGSAIPSSSTAKLSEVNISAITLSPMEETAAGVGASGDRKGEKRTISSDKENDEIVVGSYNVFNSVLLKGRATRNGKEF